MKRDLFVYISGPMTAKDGRIIEQNIADGVAVYIKLLKAGVPCFSPHLSGAFPTAWSEVPYDAWLEYDYAVIDRCTHVLMMDRWETSKGACLERDYAIKAGKTITSMYALMAQLERAA